MIEKFNIFNVRLGFFSLSIHADDNFLLDYFHVLAVISQ